MSFILTTIPESLFLTEILEGNTTVTTMFDIINIIDIVTVLAPLSNRRGRL